MAKHENPVQVVNTGAADHIKPKVNRGGESTIFGDGATPKLRQKLNEQTQDVLKFFQQTFANWDNAPGVAKVTLVEKALAKSHRPNNLFSSTTCPIIGTLNYGELLISVTPTGLEKLQRRINKSNSKKVLANISAVEDIKPYTSEERLAHLSNDIRQTIAEGANLKLKLFDHHNQDRNGRVKQAFNRFVNENNLPVEVLSYGDNETLYNLHTNEPEIAEKLEVFFGLRSISPMPTYALNDYGLQANPAGMVDESLCPAPDPTRDYPVVGVIDSGVCPNAVHLQPWILASETYHPIEHTDYAHGTSVAGLIANSKDLNQGDPRFPLSQAKIIDVCAFPKGGRISEAFLVSVIEASVKKYPAVKVWNLSIGGETPAHISEFSDFARFLDKLHDKYGVLFVTAAGNQNDSKFWPTLNGHPSNRISSPGDCIRGLTVGSITHKESATALVKSDHTSPFSRIGPGPCFIPKPEVVHFGGNVMANGNSAQLGVLSTGPNNQLLENIGTSFATPIVSAITAELYHAISDGGKLPVPTERMKALLIHSAMLRSNGEVSSGTINYRGFGCPGDLSDSLYCDDHAITLVFETDVQHGGFEFQKFPFPIPDCLITGDGKFKGEMFMTLAYSPLTDPSYASEYCRTNVDAGMGSYEEVEPGKLSFASKVPYAPKNMKELYEKAQIENGFKWSPVKAYHKQFPRGIAVESWRLKMSVTRRAEEPMPSEPQPATLILTIRALDEGAPVYNEMIVAMNNIGWTSNNLDQYLHIKARN